MLLFHEVNTINAALYGGRTLATVNIDSKTRLADFVGSKMKF